MKPRILPLVVGVMLSSWLASAPSQSQKQPAPRTWTHLTSKQGDLPAPNGGKQQTASLVLDIDQDGVNDFVITERTQPPAAVWYRRGKDGWTKYVIEAQPLRIEAGGASADIDSDGDLDVVFAGDAQSNEVWWWENPYPDYDPAAPWIRHIIKRSGGNKHHDQMFGDFDGDGQEELVLWNQGADSLLLCEVPVNPRADQPWPCTAIYTYSADSEPLQRGKSPSWKGVNEHEGLAAADIDGDGKLDIVGGGLWFKYRAETRFIENIIDANYPFSRSAAGDLKKGGRPEVVLVVGDGEGPLLWYEWVKGTWTPHTLLEVTNGHSLAVVDFDGDGNLDIFCAEMRLGGGSPEAKTYILLGDGNGNFKTTVVARGYGNHESRVADLDGDGDLDILGKPYNWDTPRLDLWLHSR